MANSIASIQIKELDIGFKQPGESTILSHAINIDAHKGQLIGLIGSNGIGKSTFLRTICQLQPVIGGQIYIENQPANQLTQIELAKHLSLVSTDLTRTGRLLVNDLVGLGRYPYSNWMGTFTKNDQRIVDEALKQVGMYSLKYRDSATLSDGEYQRVMIARALAQDTSVIILDEPTAFLDLPNKYAIIKLLHDLCRQKNKCIIFSTHDLNIAMQFADVFWILGKEGIINGAPEDLILNKEIEQLFKDSGVFFDQNLLQFKVQQPTSYNVHLEGDESVLNLVKLALNRMGISTDCNKAGGMVVKAFKSAREVKWDLVSEETELSGATIYNLQRALINELETKN